MNLSQYTLSELFGLMFLTGLAVRLAMVDSRVTFMVGIMVVPLMWFMMTTLWDKVKLIEWPIMALLLFNIGSSLALLELFILDFWFHT